MAPKVSRLFLTITSFQQMTENHNFVTLGNRLGQKTWQNFDSNFSENQGQNWSGKHGSQTRESAKHMGNQAPVTSLKFSPC